MDHLIKRPGQPLIFEAIDTNGNDENCFAVHKALCQLVDDVEIDRVHLGDDYIFIVGDNSGIDGKHQFNFIVHGDSGTGIKELDIQLVCGPAIFCRYNVVDEFPVYTELDDEEVEAIEKAFNVMTGTDKEGNIMPVFNVKHFHALMGWV